MMAAHVSVYQLSKADEIEQYKVSISSLVLLLIQLHPSFVRPL